MSDYNDLEHLAIKSKEIVDKQIASYRQQHTTASSIVAIIAIFLPLFVAQIGEANWWIKICSCLVIGLFLIALGVLLFKVFLSQPLAQALRFELFEGLLSKKDYNNILTTEIGANRSCFEYNKVILDKRNSNYNNAITLSAIAIFVSAILLMVNALDTKSRKQKETAQLINKIIIVDSTKSDTIILTKSDTIYNPLGFEK